MAEIAAGGDHTCARMTDGTVKCWGRNQYGALGDGTTTNRNLPTAVPLLSNVDQIAAGYDHTCARLADGTFKCWGRNVYGALGDGTTTHRSSPTPVLGL